MCIRDRVPPTNTPIPPTPTPQPDAVVNTQNANLRAGPGTAYETLGSYPQGTALAVTGKNAAGAWLQVQAPDGKAGWMASSLLTVNTNLGSVAVAAAPPTPTPIVRVDGSMVFVPAGEFLMGNPVGQGHAESQLQRSVYLDAFYIDRTEVTVAQFQRCVEAGACSLQSRWPNCNYGDASKSDHPINCVNWSQAVAYCSWAGKRLPTDVEWEKAARGTSGWIYPWGNRLEGNRANYCDVNCTTFFRDTSVDDGYQFTAPVGSYPAGASPYGALDMAGNVSEWVSDWYDRADYASLPLTNPIGPASGDARVLRGSAFSSDANDTNGLRTAARNAYPPDYDTEIFGFRCARSP